MDWNTILPLILTLVIAGLGVWRTRVAKKGEKDKAELLDAIIDGVEIAKDITTKQVIDAKVSDAGMKSKLDKVLAEKGYKGKSGDGWKSDLYRNE